MAWIRVCNIQGGLGVQDYRLTDSDLGLGKGSRGTS